MLLKKIAIATMLLSTTGVALAGISGTPYIGAGLGLNQQMFNDKWGSYTTNYGGTGGVVNVYGGYGALVNKNIYLGGEILANTTTGVVEAVKSSSDNSSLKFRTKYTYGASILPGYMLTDNTMVYARVGIVKTKFNVKSDLETIEDESENTTVAGGQFGLGMQTKVARNMDLRGEYVYTNYNSFHSFGNKINASSGQANVGVVYSFS